MRIKNLLKDDIQSKYCVKKVKQHNIKDEESGHKSQEETEDGKIRLGSVWLTLFKK